MAPSGSVDGLWRKLEQLLKIGKLIPVFGPGCITFGPDDQPLYPWLAEQLVRRLDIELPHGVESPLDLHTVAVAHLARRGGGRLDDISLELDILLDPRAKEVITPGPLLRDVCRVGAFSHFFTLAFDPLLERALGEVRYGGLRKPELWEYSLGQAPQDLPFAPRNAPRTLLSYLFGRISPNPSFHIWDHDAIEFIFSLQRTLPSLNTLATTLGTNNLLFLGSDFSDWLARFFLRVIKGKPLKEEALPFLLAERRMRLNPESVLFYNALKGHIEIVHESPIEFAREFVARALRGFALAEEPAAPTLPAVDREIPEGAIFVSYCHTDREFAFRVTEKLQRHGCLVWLDRDRLQAGDNFENELEDAIKRCVLFLSLITPSTEGRIKSYFHKERGWAELQATMFAPDETFYVPVASEGTRLPVQREPRRFADIHIEIAVGGNISDDLCERLRFLQQERIRRP